MKIIHKDRWGLFFKNHFFIVEGEDGCLEEVNVVKETWYKFNVGDYFDPYYRQFYKYDDKKF